MFIIFCHCELQSTEAISESGIATDLRPRDDAIKSNV